MALAAYWNRGVDWVPVATGAAAVMDCRDLVAACEDLGVATPLRGRVLDVGCGTGRWAQRCPDGYLGCDIAADAVAYCARAGVPAVVLRDEAGGDLPAGPFAWACCFSVFTHVDAGARAAVLRALRARAPRLLADVIPGDGGGHVELWTAHWTDFRRALADAGWRLRAQADRRSPDLVLHRYVYAEAAEDGR